MTIVPRRRLGRTDLEISTVGLGTWALGGAGWADSWDPQDDEQSVRTIHLPDVHSDSSPANA